MRIPSELIPICPNCGKPLTTNLRADSTFVQDKGWDEAADRYQLFEQQQESRRTVYLEIGVGFNTPGIIKYNFWQKVHQNPKARYICLNKDSADAPDEIKDRAICVAEIQRM